MQGLASVLTMFLVQIVFSQRNWQCYVLARFYAYRYLYFIYTTYYIVLPLSCLLSFSFLDVLQSRTWLEANSLSDPSLHRIVPDLLDLQLESKAPSTLQKYRSGWLKRRDWAASKIGVQVIPPKPLHNALFMSELVKNSFKNDTGISPIVCPLHHYNNNNLLLGSLHSLYSGFQKGPN